MHPSVTHLIELQRVDLRLIEVRARLATFPKRLAEVEARVAAARSQLAAAKTAHTQSLKDRKTYEMDVDQWKEKVRKYKDQTGAVKTNDAYKALLHEIEMAEAQIAKAEDRLLERMVAGEEFDKQIKAAEKAIAEADGSAKTDRVQIETEKGAAEKELAGLEAERAAAAGAIDEDLVDHYQRVARTRAGVALAETRDEMCLKCGMRLRPHVYQELRSAASHELFHCESCARILYYIEPPAAQAAGAGPPSAQATGTSK